MKPGEIAALIHKYIQNSLTGIERNELDNWLSEAEINRVRFSEMIEEEYLSMGLTVQREAELMKEADKVRIDWDAIIPVVPGAKVVPLRSLKRRKFYGAAAVVVLIATGAGYLLNHAGRHIPKPEGQMVASNDIPAPTGTRTTLTLSNGSIIVLDSAQNGVLSRQGSANVSKLGNGQLVYSSLENSMPVAMTYNTLSTARGGQTQLVMSDGTKVFLNAASSITYPTAFSGAVREVTVAGEAYFIVAKDKAKPFHVKAPGMNVEVLGTQFNINGYDDESDVKMTLLEGSVRVLSPDQQGVVLKPGQQAKIKQGGSSEQKIKIIEEPDTAQVTAWLREKFAFNSENIEGVMKQLARWVRSSIVYDAHPDIQLSGSVSKKTSLATVLKVLELSGVHFRIEGNKVVVLK